MKSRKIYWKAIRCDRMSALISRSYTRDSISLLYPVKEWVKPKIKNSKIMVFSEKEWANSFSRAYGLMVVPCYIKNPIKYEMPRIIKPESSIYEIIKYWQEYNKNKKNIKRFFLNHQNKYNAYGLNLYRCPGSTVFCDEVYCLE